jgi:hypothetical protein
MRNRQAPVHLSPPPRPRPAARLLGTDGHVHLDLAILVFIVMAAGSFVHAGLARHSLPAVLFGAWGLLLVVGLPAAMLLAFLLERRRGEKAQAEGRLEKALEGLGDMASEAVMLTAMAYVLVPFALFLYSALVRPFFELGFSDGLKIASVMGAFTAAVLAFFWALGRFPAFAKLVVSAVLFGLLFGFAAFLTLLFFPTDGLAAWKVYAALGAEAVLSAAVCGAHFVRGLHDDPT